MKDRPETRSPGKPPDSTAGTSASRLGVLVFTAVLLWLFLAIAVFYAFHKPLPPEALERVRDAWIDLAAAGWIVWVSIGIGRPILRGGSLTGWERTALSGGLGLGALGLVFLGIAWAGLLSAGVIVFLFAALTLPVSVPLIRDIAAFLKGRRRESPPLGAFSAFLALFLAVSLILSLGIALAPPAAWDALVYQFRFPQQILSAQSLSLPHDSLLWEMPQLAGMLYTAAIGLTGRPETAAVVGWAAGLLALLGMTGAARRWGLRHALLPAALLLAGDTLARSMGWGYVDWAAALFGFAAWCSLSQKESGARWTLLAGGFAGFAAGTKYTAGIVLGVLLLAVLTVRDGKRFMREAALLLGGFLLAFGPWIARGLVFWGNPLPPLMDAGPLAAYAMDFVRRRPLENAWLLAAPMPFLQSAVGREGGFPFDMTIGPLLIALLPGALLRRKGESASGAFLWRMFWIGAVVYWVCTGIGGLTALHLVQPRLYMALFPGWAMLSAYGFERLWSVRLAKVRLGAVAAVMTVLVMGVQAVSFAQSWIESGAPNYLAGSLSRREYLEDNLGWYMRAMDAAVSLPGDSRVLMLWEPRGLYCGEVCREDVTIDRWYLLMRSGWTAEEILAEWRGEGWTHLLVFDAGAEFERATRSEYPPSDWEQLECLLEALPLAERFGDGYTLYVLQ
ncbi:MAG: hypothetical protein ACK2UB_06680 [Anaerolineales bacterium]